MVSWKICVLQIWDNPAIQLRKIVCVCVCLFPIYEMCCETTNRRKLYVRNVKSDFIPEEKTKELEVAVPEDIPRQSAVSLCPGRSSSEIK